MSFVIFFDMNNALRYDFHLQNSKSQCFLQKQSCFVYKSGLFAFWLSLSRIWNFENIFHPLTSNNWIKYSDLCLPCYLIIFKRFLHPIIGSLIHNSINLVMLPFYNWHLSSRQSFKLIEQIFCGTWLPNIGSFTPK